MIAVTKTDLTPLCDAEDVLYTSIVLDRDSRDKLMSITPPMGHEGSTRFGHHVTLAFGRDADQDHVNALDFGKEVIIKAKSIVWNSYCIAVEVELPEDVKSNNKHPHVTICTADGIPPVYSNKLLQDNARGLGEKRITEYSLPDMELKGRIECKMKS